MMNELYHHGVLGQRWGVRRYQPYPDDYTGDGRYLKITARQNVKRASQAAYKFAKKRDNLITKEVSGKKIDKEKLQEYDEIIKSAQDAYKEASKHLSEKEIYKTTIKSITFEESREMAVTGFIGGLVLTLPYSLLVSQKKAESAVETLTGETYDEAFRKAYSKS